MWDESGSVSTVSSALSSAVRPLTVLLVEDEFLIRLDLSEGLRNLGYSVIEAVSADEGLKVLQSGADIQVVVTDRRVPGTLDGGAFVQLVRQTFAPLKIVMVSGEPQADDLRDQLDGFLLKPCRPDDVGDLLQRLGLHAEP
jgi:CheY-like chemotaxis protein